MALLCGPAVQAQAEGCFGAGQPLFHCDLGDKSIDICLQGDVAIYRSGPRDGPAELVLARHVRDVAMTPRGANESQYWIKDVTFRQSNFTYKVSYAINRVAKGEVPKGADLRVQEGDTVRLLSTCDRNSVSIADFRPVSEAKKVAGQCWTERMDVWENC